MDTFGILFGIVVVIGGLVGCLIIHVEGLPVLKIGSSIIALMCVIVGFYIIKTSLTYTAPGGD